MKSPNQQITPRQRLKTLCHEKKQIWMGIINLSPQSFSTDKTKKSFCLSSVMYQAESFIKNGASILDIGAVPTNPLIQNALVDPEKEIDALYNLLCSIRKEFGDHALISVDTYSPIVAHTLAQESLIDIVNDIYGGRKIEQIKKKGSRDKTNFSTLDVVANFSLGYILMHMSGELESLKAPDTNTNISAYLDNILNFFHDRKARLFEKHIDFCIFDPGVGGGRFGKNLDVILSILSKQFLINLKNFGFPILVGLSRKGFLKELYPHCTTPCSRDVVSKIWENICFQNGATIIRTHVI
jgi:dihydropteroate synthase